MASAIERAPVTPDRVEQQRARPGVWLTDVLLLVMALIWGLNYTVVKFGVRAFTPLAFNGLRVGLAAVALLAVAALAVREPWPPRRVALHVLGLGVLGNCVYQVFFIEGISRTRAGTASLLLAASPAFIAVIGRLRGSERVTRRGAAGIALSIAGVGLVMSAGAHARGDTLLGNLLILIGCLCWATFTVLLQPYTHRFNGIHLSALTMTGGALPLLAIAAPAIVSAPWSTTDATTWWAVAYSGIGALVVAYLIWYRGVRVLGPTRTAMYGNLQPVIALSFAWLTLGEVPTVRQLVGAAAIVTGIVMTRR